MPPQSRSYTINFLLIVLAQVETFKSVVLKSCLKISIFEIVAFVLDIWTACKEQDSLHSRSVSVAVLSSECLLSVFWMSTCTKYCM